MVIIASKKAKEPTPRGEDGQIDQEAAATKIQSIYRGRKARQRAVTRQAESEAKNKNEGRSRGRESGDRARGENAAAAPKLLSGGGASSSSSGEQSRLPSNTGDEQPDELFRQQSKQTNDSNWSPMQRQLEGPAPTWLRKTRVSIYLLFEEPRSSLPAQILSIFILVMIIVSIVCFMAETMPELKHVSHSVWLSLEICCTGVFTIEYITRISVCTIGGITPWQFAKDTMNKIDLMAILPFYISVIMSAGPMAKALGVLRVIRLVRLFRIFKLGRYSAGLRLMALALKNSAQALWVLCFFLCVGILLFSSAVYYAEKMSCPDVDDLKAEAHRLDPSNGLTEWNRYVLDCRVSPTGKHTDHGLCCDEYGSPLDFPSIVEAFWWSTVTMTTVGFGEVYPRTELGRIIATATMLSGILLIALPVAIIGRKFQEAYEVKEYNDTYGTDYTTFTQVLEGSRERQELEALQRATTTQALPTPKLPVVEKASEATKAPEGPSLNEMSRRLRTMQWPDKGMTDTAVELAAELEDVGDMQQEILVIEKEERARRAEVVDLFDGLLKRFGDILDPPEDTNKGKNIPSFGGLNMRMLMFAKKGDAAPQEAVSMSPPLSPRLPAGVEAHQAAAQLPGAVEDSRRSLFD